MSIATLKRKTLAKYNNSSVNTGEGFSLNGAYRNQGYVGQKSKSRTRKKYFYHVVCNSEWMQ